MDELETGAKSTEPVGGGLDAEWRPGARGQTCGADGPRRGRDAGAQTGADGTVPIGAGGDVTTC